MLPLYANTVELKELVTLLAQASITGGAGRSMEYIEPNFHLNASVYLMTVTQ